MSLGYSKSAFFHALILGLNSPKLFTSFCLRKIILSKWLNLLVYLKCKERMYFYIKIYSCKRRLFVSQIAFLLQRLTGDNLSYLNSMAHLVFTNYVAHPAVPNSSDRAETFKHRNWVKLLEGHLSESPDCLKQKNWRSWFLASTKV